MKWITRERPKIDRIACPWLIAGFIDEAPEFLFVPAQDAMTAAASRRAQAWRAIGSSPGFQHGTLSRPAHPVGRL